MYSSPKVSAEKCPSGVPKLAKNDFWNSRRRDFRTAIVGLWEFHSFSLQSLRMPQAALPRHSKAAAAFSANYASPEAAVRARFEASDTYWLSSQTCALRACTHFAPQKRTSHVPYARTCARAHVRYVRSRTLTPCVLSRACTQNGGFQVKVDSSLLLLTLPPLDAPIHVRERYAAG